MMKKILIALLLVVVVIGGGVVYMASNAGKLIQQAVLDYGPKVIGAKIDLAGVDVDFWGGTASIKGLVIHNPDGFKSAHALKIDSLDVGIDLGSLTSDVIRISQVRMEGANVIYEIGTKGNNISRLQKNVDAYVQSLGLEENEDESTAKFQIDHVYINKTKVKLATDLLGGKGAGVTLPDIHLKDIGQSGDGASLSDVMKKILGAINGGLGKAMTTDMIKNTVKGVGDKLKGLLK